MPVATCWHTRPIRFVWRLRIRTIRPVRWVWRRFVMARSARARPVAAIGRWRLTSGRIWRFTICSMPSMGCPRSRWRPRGLPCDPRRSPTIRLRWRTGWLRRCSLRTRMNCAAFLFSIAPRWTPTVTPPSAPVSRPFLLIADRSLIARLAGWRPANRRPQTGQSQAKLTE